MLPDGTIAYVRPENEFRAGGSTRRFLEIPTWKSNERIQELSGKGRLLSPEEMQAAGIKPHVTKSGGKPYVYKRFVSEDLTKEESAELRSLMIEAAANYEPRLISFGEAPSPVTRARRGRPARPVRVPGVVVPEITEVEGLPVARPATGFVRDENAPPFAEKLRIAKPNTLQKWAQLGGVYYSVITAELDEIRCIGSGPNQYVDVENPTDEEVTRQMAKHARQPFAMDRHLSKRELIAKNFKPGRPSDEKMAPTDQRAAKDFVLQLRKLVTAGQQLKVDDKGNYHMYNDGVHGTRQKKQSRKQDLPVAGHVATLKSTGVKPCDECGMIPMKLTDYLTPAKATFVRGVLKKFGFDIGADDIVYLLHLEQLLERYGLILDPNSETVGDNSKCVYSIGEATISKLIGEYSPEDIDQKFVDVQSEISAAIESSETLATAAKNDLKKKVTRIRDMYSYGEEPIGIYKKSDYNTWEANVQVLRNMIDNRIIQTLGQRQ
jgi:hypothetical protein